MEQNSLLPKEVKWIVTIDDSYWAKENKKWDSLSNVDRQQIINAKFDEIRDCLIKSGANIFGFGKFKGIKEIQIILCERPFVSLNEDARMNFTIGLL